MAEPVRTVGTATPATPATPALPPTEPARPVDERVRDRTEQLKAAGVVVAVLAVVGAVLGLVWQAWSPPGPIGGILPAGIEADETEAFVAGDGRFTAIALAVGVVAGLLAWYLPALRNVRGPYVAVGLAVGGVAGSLLTLLVGWAVRGQGSTFTCGVGTCIDHLPLTVHMHGLLFAQAFVAVLGYGLFVSFAADDDLGRPDPYTTGRAVANDEPRGAVVTEPSQQSTVG